MEFRRALSVSFQVKNGSTNLGSPVTSGAVSGGAASVTYPLPAGTAAGSYTIVATYNPSSNFNGSSDNSGTLTVNPTGTTTKIGRASCRDREQISDVAVSLKNTTTSSTVSAGTVTLQ